MRQKARQEAHNFYRRAPKRGRHSNSHHPHPYEASKGLHAVCKVLR